jgi:hypothetical protein
MQTPAGTTPEKSARTDFLAALRNTFRSPDGARVLDWLHATAATRKPAFLPAGSGALDPLAAAVRDGRKGLVWEIESNLALAESGEPAKPATRPGPRARTKRA